MSDFLTEELTASRPIKMKWNAATDVSYTDWMIKLMDVYADGLKPNPIKEEWILIMDLNFEIISLISIASCFSWRHH